MSMTPREEAEQIVRQHVCGGHGIPAEKDCLVEVITTAIQAASNKGVAVLTRCG